MDQAGHVSNEKENAAEQSVALGAAPLMKECGVWVLRTGEPLSASETDELLQRIREERDLANLGN